MLSLTSSSIERAKRIAYDFIIPLGFDHFLWRELSPAERFYIKGLESEKRTTVISDRRYEHRFFSKNKQKFREEHDSDLRIYEAARKTLNEEFGGQDLMQIKDIDQELTRLKTEIKGLLYCL